MNPRVTIGMLAILLALGLYVFYGPTTATAPSAPIGPAGALGKPAAAPPTPDPTLQLWMLDEAQVQSVIVQRGGQEAGVERDGEDWRIVPSGGTADRLRVNSLVFRLANVRAMYRVPTVTDDAEFGLNAPALRATIRLAGGETEVLTVGAKAVAETGTYARMNGDQSIFLVSNALVQDLERLVTEPPLAASPVPSPAP